MKYLSLLLLSVLLLSCSSDDDQAKECLVCNSLDGNDLIDITSEDIKNLCVGVVGEDPDTGETVTITREILDSYATILNAFGGDCKVQ